MWAFLDPVDIRPILQLSSCIRATGCRNVSFRGAVDHHGKTTRLAAQEPIVPFQHLETFEPRWNVLFLPPYSRFIADAYSTSSVKDLNLAWTLLMPSQWVSYLSQLTVPFLETMEINTDIPLTTILKFISRHTSIHTLTIHSGTRAVRSNPCRCTELPKLQELDGPAAYIQVLLKSIICFELHTLTICLDLSTTNNGATLLDDILTSALGYGSRLTDLRLHVTGDLPDTFFFTLSRLRSGRWLSRLATIDFYLDGSCTDQNLVCDLIVLFSC
jgi:hypothetical protein